MSKHFTLPYEGGLIDKNLPAGILHTYEKIWTHVYPESRPASYAIADLIVDAINAHKGGLFRLGLTTGATPKSLYNELVRRYEAGKVSFKNVEVVSIDEYYPASMGGQQSRNFRIHNDLLDKVDILKENIHIPDGNIPAEELTTYCADFDAKARGVDLMVIGIGEQGQVGFNEAGANEKTRTRVVRLSYGSRKRQSVNFNMDIMATPDKAITVGISTLLSAKKIILMAWGEDKAAAVKAIAEGPMTTDCPASLLQDHDHISFTHIAGAGVLGAATGAIFTENHLYVVCGIGAASHRGVGGHLWTLIISPGSTFLKAGIIQEIGNSGRYTRSGIGRGAGNRNGA